MLRYVIAVGSRRKNSEFERVTELRRRIQNSPDDWRTAIDAPGIYAASVPDLPTVESAIALSENRGVIFGALFKPPERSGGSSSAIIRSIPGNEAEGIIRSKGRSMIRD